MTYTHNGVTYERRVADGPRKKLQVWNGSAYLTSNGGVTKAGIEMVDGRLKYKSRRAAAMRRFETIREVFEENRRAQPPSHKRKRSSK